MKVSRKLILFIAIPVLIVVMIGYLIHDLRLGDDDSVYIPDVVVKNIKINREVNGKNWSLSAPEVEHKDGKIYGKELDITIREQNGKTTYVKAKSGVFTRSSNDIELENADATMTDGKKNYTLTSGYVQFLAEREIWNFDKNVRMTDGKMVITGKSGKYDQNSGDATVSGGGKITW